MKFIKKTLAYILPAMMLLGSTTACSDFINIDPENKVPEQSVRSQMLPLQILQSPDGNTEPALSACIPKCAHQPCTGPMH